MPNFYEDIDAALREVERTGTRRPILDLMAQAFREGQEAEDVIMYGENLGGSENPYEA